MIASISKSYKHQHSNYIQMSITRLVQSALTSCLDYYHSLLTGFLLLVFLLWCLILIPELKWFFQYLSQISYSLFETHWQFQNSFSKSLQGLAWSSLMLSPWAHHLLLLTPFSFHSNLTDLILQLGQTDTPLSTFAHSDSYIAHSFLHKRVTPISFFQVFPVELI